MSEDDGSESGKVSYDKLWNIWVITRNIQKSHLFIRLNRKRQIMDYFGFFLKPMGKHWKWSDSSRNAKKKISLLWGGGSLYRTVPYCTKLYSIPAKFGLKKTFFAFLDELGHINQFLCVFGQLKKKSKFLAISKL